MNKLPPPLGRMYVDDHERRQIVMEKINFMTANKWQLHNQCGPVLVRWSACMLHTRGNLHKCNIFRAGERWTEGGTEDTGEEGKGTGFTVCVTHKMMRLLLVLSLAIINCPSGCRSTAIQPSGRR